MSFMLFMVNLFFLILFVLILFSMNFLFRVIHQSSDVSGNRLGQAVEAVPPLQHRDQAALRVLGGNLEQNLGQFGKVLIVQCELAQGISPSGIKAGRNEN